MCVCVYDSACVCTYMSLPQSQSQSQSLDSNSCAERGSKKRNLPPGPWQKQKKTKHHSKSPNQGLFLSLKTRKPRPKKKENNRKFPTLFPNRGYRTSEMCSESSKNATFLAVMHMPHDAKRRVLVPRMIECWWRVQRGKGQVCVCARAWVVKFSKVSLLLICYIKFPLELTIEN